MQGSTVHRAGRLADDHGAAGDDKLREESLALLAEIAVLLLLQFVRASVDLLRERAAVEHKLADLVPNLVTLVVHDAFPFVGWSCYVSYVVGILMMVMRYVSF